MRNATTTGVILALVLIMMIVGSASAAPYRWLMTVQNDSYSLPAPGMQYYQSGAMSSAEFYDHPYSGLLMDYPWGGAVGSESIKAVPENVQVDPYSGGIYSFDLVVSVTNDTYDTEASLWSTYGVNYFNQSAEDIVTQSQLTMDDVRLCCEFADDGILGNLDPAVGIEPTVYAMDWDDLAWYGNSYDDPPYPDPGLPGDYVVPTYYLAQSLAPGETATRTISFGTHLPIMPDDPLYSALTSGECTDLFVNRAYSLKISDYPDAINGCDTGEAAPWNSAVNCSSVSVFFDSPESEPCLSVRAVYSDDEMGASQFWWHDPSYQDKVILMMELRAGSGGPVNVAGITLWADDYVGIEHIQQVRVYADMNDSRSLDPGDMLMGSGNFDPATRMADIAITTPGPIDPGGLGIGIVTFVMDPDTPAGSEFYCDLVDMDLGTCQNILGLPVYSDWRQWAAKLTTPEVKMLDMDEYGANPVPVVIEGTATCDVETDDWMRILYLEEPNRSCGIRVEGWSSYMAQPMVEAVGPSASMVRAAGYVQQSWTGETLLSSEWIEDIGVGELISPVAMPNRSIGGGEFGNQAGVMHDVVDSIPGCGLNNVGLLVKTWGIVTHVEPWGKGFWIEDGTGRRSGVRDDFGGYVYGIYVTGDGQWWSDYVPGSGWPFEAPAVGTKVAVTGISTVIDCYEPGAEMQVVGPCILLRGPDDLQTDDTPSEPK